MLYDDDRILRMLGLGAPAPDLEQALVRELEAAEAGGSASPPPPLQQQQTQQQQTQTQTQQTQQQQTQQQQQPPMQEEQQQQPQQQQPAVKQEKQPMVTSPQRHNHNQQQQATAAAAATPWPGGSMPLMGMEPSPNPFDGLAFGSVPGSAAVGAPGHPLAAPPLPPDIQDTLFEIMGFGLPPVDGEAAEIADAASLAQLQLLRQRQQATKEQLAAQMAALNAQQAALAAQQHALAAAQASLSPQRAQRPEPAGAELQRAVMAMLMRQEPSELQQAASLQPQAAPAAAVANPAAAGVAPYPLPLALTPVAQPPLAGPAPQAGQQQQQQPGIQLQYRSPEGVLFPVALPAQHLQAPTSGTDPQRPAQ